MLAELLEHTDPRVDGWPLMQSFLPTGIISCLYVGVVFIGPKIMASRQPFDLHNFVMCHNIVLVLLNAYSSYLLLGGAIKAGYNFLCQPFNYESTEGAMMVASGIWWYYFLRAIDLIDTLILILRKKNSHLSFLHTYHHATMFPIWWFGTKYIAGGNAFFGPLLNSFVHMVMYTYYAIAALGPKYRKYLWWKRYLTVIQMLQFLLVICHSIQTLLSECEQPFKNLHYVQMVYLLSLFFLFSNFYYQQYRAGSKTDKSFNDTHHAHVKSKAKTN